jgi:hypothetical protein
MLDHTIPLRANGLQVEPLGNLLAQGLQLQHLQSQNRLATHALSEQQAAAEERNALRSYLRNSPDLDSPEGQSGLYRAAPTQAAKILGDRLELKSKQSTIEKHAAETARIKANAQHEGIVRGIQALAGVADPQSAVGWLNEQVNAGHMSPQTAQASFQALQQDFAGWKQRTMMGAVDVAKQMELTLPKMEKVDTGGSISFVNTNPMAAGGVGPMRGVAPMPKSVSPDATLQAQTSRSNNAATVAASLANATAVREQAQATRDAAQIQTGFKNETDLRKEFEGLPEVKNYKQAYPSYAGIVDASKRSTPMADINMVYGLAKLYDPTSVVREGEYATVANSPNIPERVKGWAQYLSGGGKLTPEVKSQIVAEAQSRISTYKAEHDKARGSYEGIAKRRGIDPANVFQATGDAPSGGSSPRPHRPPLSSFGG